MMMIMRFELLRLLRSQMAISLLIVLLLCGIYSLFYGKQLLGRRAAWQEEELALEAKVLQDSAALAKAMESSFFLWSFQKAVFLPENRWSAMSIGLSDVFRQRFYGRFTMTYYQLFGTDLANPERLAIGNFDLAFVLVYLFPLLIIALSFNVLSGERDTGILPMLRTQGRSERRLALGALLFRTLLVGSVALLLSGLGALSFGIPWSGPLFGSWILLVGLYLMVWFALCFAVISLRKSGPFNAVTLLTAWLGWVIIIPALLNLVMQPSAKSKAALMEKARVIYEENLGAKPETAYPNFYRLRPHLASGDTTQYSDPWEDPCWLHIAYGISDDALRPLYDDYRRALDQRIDQLAWFDWLSLALSAQSAFNLIAQTDLIHQANHFDDLLAYQETFRQPFFQKIFFNKKLQVADFQQFEKYKPRQVPIGNRLLNAALSLLFPMLLLGAWGWFNLRDKRRKVAILSWPTIMFPLIAVLLLQCTASKKSANNIGRMPISSIGKNAISPYFSLDTSELPLLCWSEKHNDTSGIIQLARWDKNRSSFSAPIPVTVVKKLVTHPEELPQVCAKSNGTLVLAYEQGTPTPENEWAGVIHYIESTDGGHTWNAPRLLHRDSTPGLSHSHFSLARLANGEVGAIWLDLSTPGFEDGRLLKFASTHGSNGFSQEILIEQDACECCRTYLYCDAQGILHALFRDIIRGEQGQQWRDIKHSISKDNGAIWSNPERISPDNWRLNGCPDIGPAMTTLPDKTLVFNWFTGSEPSGVFISRTPFNAPYQPKIQIKEAARAPEIASNQYGYFALTFEDLSKPATGTEIVVQVFDPIGKPSFEQTFSPKNDKKAYKNPALTVLPNGDFLLVWVAEGQLMFESIQLRSFKKI